MEVLPLQKVEKLALKKIKIFRQSRIRYLSRSMLASMFIGFGVIVAFKTGNYFFMEQSPLTYPMAAITFGAAIILISYGGGDLFTGNTFYYSYAALRKRIGWPETVKLWMTSYLGNIEIIQAKGATYYAIALALDRICTAILRDEGAVLNVSTLLNGEHGVSDVYLGVPCIVDRRGVRHILPLDISAEEQELLRKSANKLKDIIGTLLQGH